MAAYVDRVSGAILVAAGIFIVWFWIRSVATALGSSPAFRFVENASHTVLNFVADYIVLIATALAALLAIAALTGCLGHDEPEREHGDEMMAVNDAWR